MIFCRADAGFPRGETTPHRTEVNFRWIELMCSISRFRCVSLFESREKSLMMHDILPNWLRFTGLKKQPLIALKWQIWIAASFWFLFGSWVSRLFWMRVIVRLNCSVSWMENSQSDFFLVRIIHISLYSLRHSGPGGIIPHLIIAVLHRLI